MAEHYGIVTMHNAAVAAADGAIAEVSRYLTKTIEISTTGFSGTIDIQGSVDGTNFVNCRYAPIDVIGALAYVVAQLSYTTDTTRKFYTITDYWAYVKVKVTTRTVGSVTVKIHAISN